MGESEKLGTEMGIIFGHKDLCLKIAVQSCNCYMVPWGRREGGKEASRECQSAKCMLWRYCTRSRIIILHTIQLSVHVNFYVYMTQGYHIIDTICNRFELFATECCQILGAPPEQAAKLEWNFHLILHYNRCELHYFRRDT